MDFNAILGRYADLIVRHGLNVQPGQLVNIGCEPAHRQLVQLIVEQSYKAGASYVNVEFGDPLIQRSRILHSKSEYLDAVPGFIENKCRELVDTQAANLRLVGPEFPEALSDLPAKEINRSRMAQYKAAKYFYDEGIKLSKVHWCVAACATSGWAKRLFPKLEASAAEQALWKEIFRIARVDQADYREKWNEHNRNLNVRAKALNALAINTLHFVGPNTDLRVGLSDRALFRAGSEPGPRGVEFEPNIPTEECFTTPDWRKTEGRVAATRPFLVNGKLITDLQITFKDGEISSFTCTQGEDVFLEYINSDGGSKRLGEVALVGVDSPVYKSGLVFEEILFDENAACHIAIGSAYKMCLRDGATLTDEECVAIGCNESSVHTDIMISSAEVDVFAELLSGRRLQILSKGEWCGEFSC